MQAENMHARQGAAAPPSTGFLPGILSAPPRRMSHGQRTTEETCPPVRRVQEEQIKVALPAMRYMLAASGVQRKRPTRFVIPAGDTLALLALVVPSGSWTCVKRRRLLYWTHQSHRVPGVPLCPTESRLQHWLQPVPVDARRLVFVKEQEVGNPQVVDAAAPVAR